MNRDEGCYQLSHIYDRLFATTSSGERKATAVDETSVENVTGCILISK